MRLKILYVLAAAALAACGGGPRVVATSELAVVEGTSMPVPDRADLTIPARPTVIGPYDTVAVDVFGLPEFTREVQVDASGRFSLPLVGAIEASGKTPADLAVTIEERLRQSFVRNPQVTVNVKGSVSQVVTVDGEVTEPGLYPVNGRTTLMRAIAFAKGTSEFASLDDVVILRTVDDQRIAGLYNLSAIRSGRYQDPDIYANDVIIVGDSPMRRLFSNLISLSPVLTAPIIAVLQRP